jgi:HD superfamily phosphohydrolase
VIREQRLLDPIHKLIRFNTHPEDQLLWSLINTAEFQRLRRIKQLGLTDLVYPGATHSRFAHSVGTLEFARRILQTLLDGNQMERLDPHRKLVTLCAALLHDIGHGPFSHTFESMEEERGYPKSHEYWTKEIICGDTEVHQCLENYEKGLALQVAGMIQTELNEQTDLYSGIISSQFDADRLDYLLRDRYMSGVDFGHFDLSWLLDCLTIKDIIIETKTDIFTIKGLVLSRKGYKAAELYLLARFQLYTNLYLHKTTRAAEKMLGAILCKLQQHVSLGELPQTGIPAEHPLIVYYKNPSLGNYLVLDDITLWSILPFCVLAKDPLISTLAQRLLRRDLFKCVDIGQRLSESDTQHKLKFKQILKKNADKFQRGKDVLLYLDEPTASGYTWYEGASHHALKKIFIYNPEKQENMDIGDASKLVQTLKQEHFYRIYVENSEKKRLVETLWLDLQQSSKSLSSFEPEHSREESF